MCVSNKLILHINQCFPKWSRWPPGVQGTVDGVYDGVKKIGVVSLKYMEYGRNVAPLGPLKAAKFWDLREQV